MSLNPKTSTVIESVLALEGTRHCGIRFVQRSGEALHFDYHEVLERAKSAAGTLQSMQLAKGDRVAIVLPTSVEFFDAFLGTQLCGAIPTALYPPFRLGKLTEYFSRTRYMLEKIGARILITDWRIKRLLGPAAEQAASLERVVDAADLLGDQSWTPVEVGSKDPAFLQFSSGTTQSPKAVIITHEGLLNNLEVINAVLRRYENEEDAVQRGGVCWLPLYHDMGLVGSMFSGLYHPGTVTYIGPERFIAKPAVWLQTMSRYKSLLSSGPDFAYGLCYSKIKDEEMEGVDLSNWRIAFNGAEPIDTDLMDRFSERFARWGFRPEAMTPVYGLSEAGLAVTFSDMSSPPLVKEFDHLKLSQKGEAAEGVGRRLPCVGSALPGFQLEVRDQEGRKLGEGQVGRILIRGASVTPGYFGAPDLTAESIRDGWLDTGDLGFVHQGGLYISGREKDLIIIRGRNYAPQEIELLVKGIEGARPGCAVAVGHQVEGAGEQLFVLAEREPGSSRPTQEIAAEIRERILEGIALKPHVVEILAPGTLPRTSSGKLRRWEALKLYLENELKPPRPAGVGSLLKQVIQSEVAWARFKRKRKNQGPPSSG